MTRPPFKAISSRASWSMWSQRYRDRSTKASGSASCAVTTSMTASFDLVFRTSCGICQSSPNRRFGELWQIPHEVLNTRSNDAVMEVVTAQLADPDAFVERSRYLWDHMDEEARDEIALKGGRVIERYTRTLADETGAIYGRIEYFRDVTEDRKREEGHRFLAQATKELVSSLDYQATLSRIAR